MATRDRVMMQGHLSTLLPTSSLTGCLKVMNLHGLILHILALPEQFLSTKSQHP
jgi:hypothetical protein